MQELRDLRKQGAIVMGAPCEVPAISDRTARVLVVADDRDVGVIWQRHLERGGLAAQVVSSQDGAIVALQSESYDLVILDLFLSDGSALAIADVVGFRWPDIGIIPVTRRAFFADGSILSLIPNARATVRIDAPPQDVAAIAAHYAAGPSRVRAARSSLYAD